LQRFLNGASPASCPQGRELPRFLAAVPISCCDQLFSLGTACRSFRTSRSRGIQVRTGLFPGGSRTRTLGPVLKEGLFRERATRFLRMGLKARRRTDAEKDRVSDPAAPAVRHRRTLSLHPFPPFASWRGELLRFAWQSFAAIRNPTALGRLLHGTRAQRRIATWSRSATS
jgi:hypothetical protein